MQFVEKRTKYKVRSCKILSCQSLLFLYRFNVLYSFFFLQNDECWGFNWKKDLNLSYSSFDIFGYLRFYLFICNIINIKTIVWFFFIYLLYLCDTLMVWKHAMCVHVVTEASMKWNTFVHFLIFFGWLMASFCNWNSMKI